MSPKVILTSVVFSVFRDSCRLLDLPGANQIVSTHSNVQNWFYNSNLKYMDKPYVSLCFPSHIKLPYRKKSQLRVAMFLYKLFFFFSFEIH